MSNRDPEDWWESATGNTDDAADHIEQARVHAQWVSGDGAGAPVGVRRASEALDEALRRAWDAMVEVRRACCHDRLAELETPEEVRNG